MICLKCLEKDPRRRYGSADALAEELKHWLAGEPITARAATTLERAAKWARRKPTLAAAYVLGLLAALLGGLGGSAVWMWSAAESARSEAEQQRDSANSARNEANAARNAEREARADAERQRDKFEQFEYGRTIEVAHQEWRDNNVAATSALLDSTRTDLRGWEWRYLERLYQPELLTLRGTFGCFSEDGSSVSTWTGAGVLETWDTRTGAHLHTVTLSLKEGNFYYASFSQDRSRVVTHGLDDEVARVWDARLGETFAHLTSARGSARCRSARMARAL